MDLETFNQSQTFSNNNRHRERNLNYSSNNINNDIYPFDSNFRNDSLQNDPSLDAEKMLSHSKPKQDLNLENSMRRERTFMYTDSDSSKKDFLSGKDSSRDRLDSFKPSYRDTNIGDVNEDIRDEDKNQQISLSEDVYGMKKQSSIYSSPSPTRSLSSEVSERSRPLLERSQTSVSNYRMDEVKSPAEGQVGH